MIHNISGTESLALLASVCFQACLYLRFSNLRKNPNLECRYALWIFLQNCFGATVVPQASCHLFKTIYEIFIVLGLISQNDVNSNNKLTLQKVDHHEDERITWNCLITCIIDILSLCPQFDNYGEWFDSPIHWNHIMQLLFYRIVLRNRS